MAWQRYNRTTNIFEVSDNNGALWTPLVLAPAGLSPNIAYTNLLNSFTQPQEIQTNICRLKFKDTSQPTESNKTQIVGTLQQLRFQAVNDAENSGFIWQIMQLDGEVRFPQGKLGFPAAQLASSLANTLDDYEEGTWIPALVPTTSGSITTGAGTIGRYIKIGSEVFLNCYIVVASVASPVGGVYLSGLPFPIHAQGESTGTLAPNGCTGWDKPWLQVAGGSQLGVCYQNNNGVIAACAQFILANGHLTASLNYIATN